MHIALYSRGFVTDDLANIRLLLDELQREEITAVIYEPFYHSLQPHGVRCDTG